MTFHRLAKIFIFLITLPAILLLLSSTVSAGSADYFSLLHYFGTLGSGNGQFSYPEGATNDNTGNLYVTDSGNDRIQKFNKSGTFQMNIGSSGSGNGQFQYPSDVAVDTSGNIYVIDRNRFDVQKFNSSGVYQTKFGSWGDGQGQFKIPYGIAVDSSGNVYVADSGNDRIQKFNSSGVFLATYGSLGSGNGQFSFPNDIAVDNSGNMYISDTGNYRIQKLSPTGSFLLAFGNKNLFPIGPGQLSLDNQGNIFVADAVEHCVRQFSPTGELLSKIGTCAYAMKTAGTNPGDLVTPLGVTADDEGSVYVVDFANNRVEKYGYYQITTAPVYRFWNNTARHHFYTISENEKNYVVSHYPEWALEGTAFHGEPIGSSAVLLPVYRFWSDRYRGHFYTISMTERDYVIANLSHDWTYEGTAFAASLIDAGDTLPLYRFWSNNYKSHFYTTSAAERDYVIGNLAHDWTYEGIAFYVF